MKPDRLATPVSGLAQAYDAVVIGSGYGGGIAASRLARMGRSVCVLERGLEIQPGEFPKTFGDANAAFQASLPFGSIDHVGDATALFDLHVEKDMSVMVGCGLGGTSLINGNVALRPDLRAMDDPVWPAAIRDDADGRLAEGYRRAERMLAPTLYPGTVPLEKLSAMETCAEALDAACVRSPIYVSFEERENLAGVTQTACTLCGDCCSGCNVGAKNTIAMNYLPDAVNHGAALFCGTKVSHVEKGDGGWRVHLDVRDADGETQARTISAATVMVAAGTLGTNEILLRSRERGLPVSDRLGDGFTGNGDVIAFGYNNDVPINGIGIGHPPRNGADPVGPVIAGLIDLRGKGALDDGMVIEEGTIPSVLAPILRGVMPGGAVLGTDTDSGFRDFLEESGRTFESLVGGAYTGAVNHTMTFLVMAQDGAGGALRLDDDAVRVEWPDVGDRPVFKRISETLERATAALGGKYVDNPMWHKWLGRNLITVHPLGGCALTDDAASGVIDARNRVFSGPSGEAVHDGLYVVDGAAMPRCLGVNPSITISAIAERAMMIYAEDHSLEFDDAPNPGAPRRHAGPGGLTRTD